MSKQRKIDFTQDILGFLIRNTGNGDGYVLLSPETGPLSSFGGRTNLGNFSELEAARKEAVLGFMIERPLVFHRHLANRILYKSGCSHEYFLLATAVKTAGFQMPEEVRPSNDINFSITFNGKKI